MALEKKRINNLPLDLTEELIRDLDESSFIRLVETKAFCV